MVHTPPTQPRRNPPAINAPKVVIWLIAITILMHLLVTFGPNSWADFLLPRLAFNAEFLQFFWEAPLTIVGQLIGHAFVHGGWLHLLVNCAFLLAFGTPLARQIPVLSFLALYLLSAVGGALTVAAVYGTGQTLWLVGASGAVAGLVGALSRMVFLRRGNEAVPHPFSNRRGGMIFIAIFIGVNLVIGFLPGPDGQSISGESHLGGFASGILLSVLLPWGRRPGPAGPFPAND
jgi:membrane associated rhomboid family serine protease